MDFSLHSDPEMMAMQKRLEVNNFKGFSVTDNLSLINNITLDRVNSKITKLQEQIKTLVVKYKEELRKIIKRCKKHKQAIKDEIDAEQQKQTDLFEETIVKNKAELKRLQEQLDSEQSEHDALTQSFIQKKERLLNYVLVGKLYPYRYRE